MWLLKSLVGKGLPRLPTSGRCGLGTLSFTGEKLRLEILVGYIKSALICWWEKGTIFNVIVTKHKLHTIYFPFTPENTENYPKHVDFFF